MSPSLSTSLLAVTLLAAFTIFFIISCKLTLNSLASPSFLLFSFGEPLSAHHHWLHLHHCHHLILASEPLSAPSSSASSGRRHQHVFFLLPLLLLTFLFVAAGVKRPAREDWNRASCSSLLGSASFRLRCGVSPGYVLFNSVLMI